MPTCNPKQTTARDLILWALRKLGVLDNEDDPSGAMALQALDDLQSMMELWSTEHGLLVARDVRTFALTDSKLEYTYGPGGDFDAARPQSIVEAFFLDDAGNQWPIRVKDARWWNNLVIRTSTGRSTGLYFEPSYPLGTIRLEYAPYDPTIGFLVLEPMPTLTCMEDVIDLPPGYIKALKYNLAVELAPGYVDNVPQLITAQAEMSLRNLRRQNHKPSHLVSDDALTGRRRLFDVMAGPGYYP